MTPAERRAFLRGFIAGRSRSTRQLREMARQFFDETKCCAPKRSMGYNLSVNTVSLINCVLDLETVFLQ
jgi:hypothetical protein